MPAHSISSIIHRPKAMLASVMVAMIFSAFDGADAPGAMQSQAVMTGPPGATAKAPRTIATLKRRPDSERTPEIDAARSTSASETNSAAFAAFALVACGFAIRRRRYGQLPHRQSGNTA